MILTVNDKSYELDDISTSSELYLNTDSAEKAITIYTELRNMRAYTYGGRLYADRVVSKFMLSDVRGEGIRIYIKLLIFDVVCIWSLFLIYLYIKTEFLSSSSEFCCTYHIAFPFFFNRRSQCFTFLVQWNHRLSFIFAEIFTKSNPCFLFLKHGLSRLNWLFS